MTVFSTLLKTMDLAHKVNDKLEEIIVTSSLIKVCVRYCVFMSIPIYDNDCRYGFDFNDDDG